MLDHVLHDPLEGLGPVRAVDPDVPPGFGRGLLEEVRGRLSDGAHQRQGLLQGHRRVVESLRPPREHIAQATPDRSSTNHSSYEVILQLHGWQKGWEWAQRLGASTGIFVAGSRDVPTVVAKGEFAVGFAVPVTMAFDDFRSGFDIRFVHPTAGYVTPEPMAVLAGARSPRAARAFIQWALSDEGHRLFMSVGLFSIMPKYRMEGPPGSPLDRMAQFSGVRSFYDKPIRNVYDEDVAQKRYSEVNAVFRKLILERHDELKRLYCR